MTLPASKKVTASASLTPTDDKSRKQVKVKVRKTENLLFVGSEMWYDSFWLKMMFIGAAFVGARHMRTADKQTLAYVDKGYTRWEKLAIESLAAKRGFSTQTLTSTSSLLSLLNRDRDNFGLLDVMFFSHGVPGRIALNFWSSPSVDLSSSNYSQITKNAFVPNGCIYSFACRTGVSVNDDDFKNEADAKPENSLAQQLSNHFGIEVQAYLRRTYYGHVLRDSARSADITSTLRAARKTQDGNLIQIPPDHEALPHPGLADGLNRFSGPKREGTDNYALWRTAGGIGLPRAAETPMGLPTTVRSFRPTALKG